MGDGRGFVRLGVWPEVFARRAEVLGEPGDVVFECVEIDQEDGGVDGVAGHADVFGSHNRGASLWVGWILLADKETGLSASCPVLRRVSRKSGAGIFVCLVGAGGLIAASAFSTLDLDRHN